jgi:serine/threonine-protein kinase RsbW
MGHISTRDQGLAVGNTERILETRTRKLDSTKESIDRAESEALEVARRSDFRETIVEHIGVAVYEIMINAIVHGNGCNLHKKVVVTISRTPDKLKIVIAGEGKGFDPDHLPDPLCPEGVLRGYRRGVYLARAFMDEFHVQRDPAGWTTVTMVKFVDSADAGR